MAWIGEKNAEYLLKIFNLTRDFQLSTHSLSDRILDLNL